MAGTRQQVALTLGTYAKPIPAPVHNLRPARETCERCHWPDKFHGDKARVMREYASDESNTLSETLLDVRIGGGGTGSAPGEGIHWHMNLANRVEYIALDAGRLPVARGMTVCREHARASHPMPPPYVVKPNNEGSSVGVYLVLEGANAPAQLSDDMPEVVLVEEYVAGRELTVTVMGEEALAVTDILADGWYDYHAKYAPGGSRHVVPAVLPAEITEACLDHALRAHRALGCRGVSRTDFRWDERRGLAGLYLLEINTSPGMTGHSLVPMSARAAGISYEDLCVQLLATASLDNA